MIRHVVDQTRAGYVNELMRIDRIKCNTTVDDDCQLVVTDEQQMEEEECEEHEEHDAEGTSWAITPRLMHIIKEQRSFNRTDTTDSLAANCSQISESDSEHLGRETRSNTIVGEYNKTDI